MAKIEDGEPLQTAKSYADRVEEKKLDQLKKRAPVLGHAPPIPEGKLDSLLPMPQPSFDGARPPAPPAMLGGVGSAYPVNQAMASGLVKDPVSLADAKRAVVDLGGPRPTPPKTVSTETVELMTKAQESLTASQSETGEGLEKAEEAIAADKKDVPAFDFEAILAAASVLVSKERKDFIEAKLKTLDIADLIVNREIQQQVMVVPGKFSIRLRTFSQSEHLFCLRLMSEYQGPPIYMEESLNTFKLVCSVVALNDVLLPEHRKEVGKRGEEVDREAFLGKLHIIASYPVQLLADIGVQCNWFNDRVNRLFSLENLKNG